MEEGERVWFHAEGGHQRKSKLRTKRANIRSSDAGEVTRARGERGGGCSNGAQLGLTLTTLGVEPFLAPPPQPIGADVGQGSLMGHRNRFPQPQVGMGR
jgi:hypothetical protein